MSLETNSYGQQSAQWHATLPAPTGKFGIGRVTLNWADSSRIDSLAPDHRYREVQVDIWYPTDENKGLAAPYLNFKAFDEHTDTNELNSLVGAPTANSIRAGYVKTHAIEKAPFARQIRSAPLLIFSHGMGMITQLYTAQTEDLVSHGYIVVSITHPYDAWLTILPDGRYIPFETIHREAAGKSEENHIAYENKRLEWWADDIRFVITRIVDINRNPVRDFPFAGHININRIGAFGHSVGGRAAARACQIDNRIRACADQDGLARMMPFYRDEKGRGIKQPFLLIMREQNKPPSDAELNHMGLTRVEANELIRKIKLQRDSALYATGGAYRVVLNFNQTDHMSFSDLPILQSQNKNEADSRSHIFEIVLSYTRAFFDYELRGIKATLLDSKTRTPYVGYVQLYFSRTMSLR